MRPAPIALVTRLDPEVEAGWRDRLAALLPDETILSFASMTDSERTRADIAVVANPDPAALSHLPGLTWIHSLWAGVDRLVAELPPQAPPLVRLVDPELARVMAEAVLAWTLYLQRDMPAYARQQRQGLWRQLPYRPPAAVQVGVLGLGELGQAATAALLRAGFRVAGWSRSAKSVPGVVCHHGDQGVRDVLAHSDIVVCLLPLTPDTWGLINADLLALAKPGMALINFARGAILDADALVAALAGGVVSHAVLDVFETEPLPASSALWSHPDITVLPHISAPTSPDSAAAIVATTIRAYRRDGTIPSVVDRRRGY